MKKIILINAIIWAVLILVASYFFKNDPNYPYFFGILLVGFALINGLLSTYAKPGLKSKCR
ncbi:hypothetical protein [Flagellimonas allohymeniacidonis]|uniref:Uncharacterized protein n=1 Tax=Flagellimonas allohymeniacidonis TaxID=2517819 RepID=A0A4Q8QDI8_9FLAO|nr:hypothetical protein [Allomuricauda hymeniacidonis]TAI47607.1 hypothetical protein EW142_13160 [Allomuricauda hymeniacidonis]